MRICNFDTNFEVFCVFLVPIDYFNRIMCDNNTINSFTFAKTAKLIFNEAGKIKYIQISVHVLYIHVLYMYIKPMGKWIFLARGALLRNAAS